MQRQLALKIATILVLIFLLLLPLTMISDLIKNRIELRNSVVADIARSSAYSQTITGPLLVVPYSKTLISTDNKIRQEQGMLYFLPQTFKLNGQLHVESRKRGIYEARLYQLTNNQIMGTFQLPAHFGIDESQLDNYDFGEPFLAVGISDIRGINNDLKITLNDTPLQIAPGTLNSLLGSGIHATLNKQLARQGGTLNYQINLQLQGTSSLQITPIGKESSVSIQSNWPHPSFDGKFLPISRDINNQGFSAHWQTNYLASNMEDRLKYCLTNNNCYDFTADTLGVSLVNPVDHYLKTDRAIKYALLFIGLTFFGFFLFEIVKRLAIHPIQYSFIGIALALFFLLLLSLSEHIGFNLAYLCSATACVALIGFYMMGILQNNKQGLIFSVLLIALYAMLYVLLNGEDYSLLMGSILVFAVLAGAMIVTRKLDWYRLADLTQINPTKTNQSEEHNHD